MKKGNRILLVFVVILILGTCGFVGFYMIDNTKVLSTDTASIESNKWEVCLLNNSESKQNDLSLDIEKTTINIKGKITGGESIIYDLEIKNKGSIDAYLYNIINNNTDNINIKYLNEDENLETGFILKASESKSVKLVIEAKDNQDIDIDLNSKLIFNQYNFGR